MIKTYSNEQLDNLRRSGKILADALDIVRAAIKPGITTLELDAIAHSYIIEAGAIPSFKDYNGFKYSICTSVNEESIHGMPRKDKLLKEGDIVSIDIGVKYNGMCTDAARTYPVGKISDDTQRLIDVTEQCFHEGIQGLKAKSKVGDIGEKIQRYIEQQRKECPCGMEYGIIENYFGHGVGERVHEDPLVPNYIPHKKTPKIVKDWCRTRLPAGSVIAIEPMINAGTGQVRTASDKWTAVTVDGKLAAHYENTLIILQDGVEVVTIDN